MQRLLELATVPLQGEHFRRRPLESARAQGFEVEIQERFTRGIVERVAARKPGSDGSAERGPTAAEHPKGS